MNWRSDGVSALIVAARHDLMTAQKLIVSAAEAQRRAEATLEGALQQGIEEAVESYPSCDIPVTAHRKAHRSGRVPKIESDPELRAFIEARIDRLTFIELEHAVATHFPPTRRVRKSAIHAWWKRQSPEN